MVVVVAKGQVAIVGVVMEEEEEDNFIGSRALLL